ncbi:MAG: zinc-ribbon domain-containing protein [Myxococcota bacterium]
MQVTCGQCGAQYEFDASAIPHEGYDAQCAGCGSVFFVAPPSSEGNALVSVACKQCGAIYQFAASAIPPSGYDAQCTQCSAVFFVGGHASAPTSPPPLHTARAEDVTLPPIAPPPADVEAPVLLAEPSTAATPLGEIPTSQNVPTFAPPVDDEMRGEDGRPSTHTEDLLALSAELGEPAALPAGVSPEDDFEAIVQHRRRRWRVVLGVLAIVPLYGVVTYFLAPVTFDHTIGPVIGVKATIAPAAVPHFETGRNAMLADTEAAYVSAGAALDEALRIDRRYPAALALAGLTHLFRGSDIQARGRVFLDESAAALSKVSALEASPGRRTPQAAAQERELRAKADEANGNSAKLFEAGGMEVTAGQQLLRQALKDYGSNPMVATAAGIYYATDPDGRDRAKELLRFAIETRLGVSKKLDPKDPPDVWTAFLGAALHAMDPRELEEAAALYEAAVRLEPRFDRARYELALVRQKIGRVDESRRLAEEILANNPAHEKAKALLALLRADGEKKAVTPPPAGGKPAAAPPRRAPRRRGRGGR